jgi:hypothetical protein
MSRTSGFEEKVFEEWLRTATFIAFEGKEKVSGGKKGYEFKSKRKRREKKGRGEVSSWRWKVGPGS